MLPKFDVMGRRPTTLVLVSRDVDMEGLQVAQAVTGHHDVGPLALNDLQEEEESDCNISV